MRTSARIFLFIALAAALAGFEPAALPATDKTANAETAAVDCSGVNLLRTLEATDPALNARILEEAEALENGRAMLWKIERPGIPPSYLFGTVHLTDARVTALSDAVRLALDESKTVLLEADTSPENSKPGVMNRSVRPSGSPRAARDSSARTEVVPTATTRPPAARVRSTASHVAAGTE